MDQCPVQCCAVHNLARGDSLRDFKAVLTVWRGRTRTTWMPQQDGDERHGVKAARGANGALTMMPLQQRCRRQALIVSDVAPGLTSSLSVPTASGALAQLFAVTGAVCIAGMRAALQGCSCGRRAGGVVT